MVPARRRGQATYVIRVQEFAVDERRVTRKRPVVQPMIAHRMAPRQHLTSTYTRQASLGEAEQPTIGVQEVIVNEKRVTNERPVAQPMIDQYNV